MKIQKQLSLDGDLVRWLEERKINISGIVNQILRHIKDSQSLTAEALVLAMLQSEKDNLLKLISLHEEQIRMLYRSIEIVNEKIRKQQSIVDEIRKSERIANLMRELNEALPLSVEKALQLPVVNALRTEGIPIDEAWMERHLKRIELLGK